MSDLKQSMSPKPKPPPRSQPTSVVTGAAGFLGSHLVDLLLARGHKVIGIDNFVTGTVDNISHLGGNPNFKFIEQDVTEFIFLDVPVDYVWHFASPASPIDYLELPIQTLKVGSLGTHKALGLAMNKHARFLLASTSEIYGDPLVHPQTEDYWGNVNPIGPRGCYDEAKRFAEALTMAYHKEHRVETRIVRIFNTYGPRMRLNDGRVVPAFISQALKHRPLTVFGRGRQTRSFCYVSDLIEGIYRLMMSAYDRPGEHRQPGGNDRAGVRQGHHPRHRLAQQNRLPTLAAGRSPSAPARHHPRQKAPALGAPRAAGRRPGQNHRILPAQGPLRLLTETA